jgi:tetratricopeptide (TPR) repeat protein
MTHLLCRASALTSALFVALALASCASDRAPQQPGSGLPCRCECPQSPKGGLSTALLSRLATARALHHQADLLLARDDVDGAIAKVRGILALDLDGRWPEAEEVRLDATARLAKLLADKKKDLAGALKLVEGELERKPRPSFYAANLHSTRGDLLEAKVKQLDAAGKKVEAKALAREAMAAFERSIRINKQLQKQLQNDKAAKGVKATPPKSSGAPGRDQPKTDQPKTGGKR